jgi:hypothetical protein
VSRAKRRKESREGSIGSFERNLLKTGQLLSYVGLSVAN